MNNQSTGIEILAIDITNQCHKECPFCYNTSRGKNTDIWSLSEIVEFAADCVLCGVKSISLGGG
ncbi:MAG: radical SAM protein, partial [Muribaculaceae bacterium]|nr:radical SAM protein [Muribaculaceae bacterium]